jgi:hypothetical protein
MEPEGGPFADLRVGHFLAYQKVVLNEEDGMKCPRAPNLHNAVTVSQQRLGKRVAQLSSARMNEVCAALRFCLGCDLNEPLGSPRVPFSAPPFSSQSHLGHE